MRRSGRRLGRIAARLGLVVALLGMATGGGGALPSAPPLPPSRPAVPATPAHRETPPRATSPSTPSPTAAPSSEEIAAAEQTCTRLLTSHKVVGRSLPSIAGVGACGVAVPIELSAVVVSPTFAIPIRPAIETNCTLGEAVADWVRDDLVPAFSKFGTPLTGLSGTSSYACRGRNGAVGAKLSEHATGNAMDIGGFAGPDGRVIGVKDTGPAAILLLEVKRTACARFATVLGPGSDGFHESHMHVDLEGRRTGTHLCHWDMP